MHVESEKAELPIKCAAGVRKIVKSIFLFSTPFLTCSQTKWSMLSGLCSGTVNESEKESKRA